MKFTPYWLDTAPQGPDRSRTEIGGNVDVAIIGAGLTGLSAALHLARKGANVHVFEKDTVGFGASGRNGGMATTGLSIGFRDAVSRYGFDTAKAYLMTYHDAVDTIETLVTDEGIDCDFARTGKLNLASKPAHVEGLRKTHLRWPRPVRHVQPAVGRNAPGGHAEQAAEAPQSGEKEVTSFRLELK
jgi:glycine/D-amino acid oxidase-like deaminating enzyme